MRRAVIAPRAGFIVGVLAVVLLALLVLSPPAVSQSTRKCVGSITQQSLSSSASVPSTAVQNQTEVCVFNQDTATNAVCGDATTATTANGAMIEPRTGRCFETIERIQCISASGTITIDVEAKACSP